MTVFLHFVRHAQGEHNLSREAESIHDPKLTELGHSQCASLQSVFPLHNQVTHLIASPLQRTIQTCLAGFQPASNRGLKVLLLPKLQEVGPWACDTGSEPEIIARDYKGLVDVSRVEKDWNDKLGDESIYKAVVSRIESRAVGARRELQAVARQWEMENQGRDAHVVVVSHGAFLHFLTECFHNIPQDNATGWTNASYRAYTFADTTLADKNATILETSESWEARNGDVQRPNEKESQALRQRYHKLLAPYLGLDEASTNGSSK
ncbi:hypothetical protein CFIMG_001052RA [Ceratocystis fimbriata CBS 114723]|uniref:Phosphatase SPAC5H10.03 n=1 Tax=Ceratocystis fimbriata CBS 114723 TaxID=1035309 RepID=A0A2C5XGV1_9PEZI|nr:hypothetical protein CFIMG_001052RA [Ceratocystis fimbriata CBS 114723]